MTDIEKEFVNYDLVLLGDGSGIRGPGGWAVIAINNLHDKEKLFLGSVSDTTNNIMELIGYIHALNTYVKDDFHDIHPWKPKVLIVTDSKITKKCGSEEYEPKSNLPFWEMLEPFKNKFDITFKHIERNSNPYSKFADKVAGKMRKEVENKQEAFSKELTNINIEE